MVIAAHAPVGAMMIAGLAAAAAASSRRETDLTTEAILMLKWVVVGSSSGSRDTLDTGKGAGTRRRREFEREAFPWLLFQD